MCNIGVFAKVQAPNSGKEMIHWPSEKPCGWLVSRSILYEDCNGLKHMSARKLTKPKKQEHFWHIEVVNMLASGWTSTNLEELKETSTIFKPWASSFRIFQSIGRTWYQFVSRIPEAGKHANHSLKQSKRNHDLCSALFVYLEQDYDSLYIFGTVKTSYSLETVPPCLWSAFQTHPMNLSTSSNNPMNLFSLFLLP